MNVQPINVIHHAFVESQEDSTSNERQKTDFTNNRSLEKTTRGAATLVLQSSQFEPLREALQKIDYGLHLLHIIDGSLEKIHDLLSDGLQVAVLASSSLCSQPDRMSYNQDLLFIQKQIDEICSSTTFQSHSLLNGEIDAFHIAFDKTNNDAFEVNLAKFTATCQSLGFAKQTLPNFYVPIRLQTKEHSIEAVEKILSAMEQIASKHVRIIQYVLQLEKVLFERSATVPNFNEVIIQSTVANTKSKLVTNGPIAASCQVQDLNQELLSNLIIH